MDVFEAIADPVRRTILESLTDGPRTAGELAGDFSISRPAVSRHLRVLREAALLTAEVVGRTRIYRLEPSALGALDEWLDGFRRPGRTWEQRFDALETEVRRTGRERRSQSSTSTQRKAAG